MAMDANELRGIVEAILFLSSEPVRLDDLAESFPEEGRELIAAQLEEIRKTLEEHFGGFILEQTAGGWRLATRAEHDPVLKKYFAKKGENRLSIAALETLAIIAYRQPITAPEVSEIRGVNSTGVIRTLLERRMIRFAGRKNVVGSPFLYRTTREFLVHFGLNDVRDLPRLEDFGDLIGETINDDLVAAINAVEPDAQNAVDGGEESADADTESESESVAANEDDRNEVASSSDGDEAADRTSEDIHRVELRDEPASIDSSSELPDEESLPAEEQHHDVEPEEVQLESPAGDETEE